MTSIITIDRQEGCTPCSLSKRSQTVLNVSSVVTGFVLTLFAVLGYLSYRRVIPPSFGALSQHWAGNLALLLSGGALWIFSVFCCCRNNRKQKQEATAENSPDPMQKMIKNLEKAQKEHGQEVLELSFVAKDDITTSQRDVSIASTQGNRRHMEDQAFYQVLPVGVLYGVFDGHGTEYISSENQDVATYSCEFFKQHFLKYYLANKDDVRKVFIDLFEALQKAIENEEDRLGGGSVATVSFFEKSSGFLYVANLGDCSTKICRDGTIIALSCERSFASEKDFQRVVDFAPDVVQQWGSERAKHRLRFPFRVGINTSRTVGDLGWRAFPGGEQVLSVKPKVSVFPLQSGDRLIMGSDGVWEVIKDEELSQIGKTERNPQEMAAAIIAAAEAKRCENATAIVAKFE